MSEAGKGECRNPGDLKSQLRRQVEQLTYLPASAAVAVKFIEIGKDADAGPKEYEKIISSDTSLSTRVLALANSSWFGVRNKVTKILHAITLLGLANVRTLAVSYCMAGLYSAMKIKNEDVNRYWQASLCKGVAAKSFAGAIDAARADEAFLTGLFQDMAIPLIQSVAPNLLLSLLQAQDRDTQDQLRAERDAFGVDHTEVGRWLATKLELPETYVDAIAFHHDSDCVRKFIGSDTLANAIQVAALFPHVPDQWNPLDVERLRAFLLQHAPDPFKDAPVFLETVQQEFDTLYGFFDSGVAPGLRLAELMPDACREIADSATSMVGRIQGMMNEAAKTGTLVDGLVTENERLEDKTRVDALTGALNRAGFLGEGDGALAEAARYATPFVVVYFDIDKFKSINDTHGHAFGDFVLRELCTRIRRRVRKADLFGRLGGDEFALLLNDTGTNRVHAIVDAIQRGIREERFVKGKVAVKAVVSLGVLLVPGSRTTHDLTALLAQADTLMYESKRSGTGQPRYLSLSAVGAAELA